MSGKEAHNKFTGSGMSFNLNQQWVLGVETAIRAEVKRSWFTFRDSLRATRTGGKLWLPASITFEETVVRISTSEGEKLLRPRRLAWAGPNTLLVSGLDPGGHVQRSVLRFATVEEANEAVSAVNDLGVLGPELVPKVEEIPCQIRVVVPKEVLLVIVALFLPGLTLVVASQIVGSGPLTGWISLSLFAVLVSGRRFWLPRLVERMLKSTNPLFFRNIKGGLKVEEQRLILNPYYYSGSMVPTLIQWRSPSIFLLKLGRTKFKLTFSTSEDAAKAAVLVKTNFPQVQETWMANP